MKILMAPAIAAVLAMLGGWTSAAAQVASTGAERFYLSGVVVVDGGDAKAWLQEPTLTNDRPVVVRVGDRIGRWTLTAISPNRVELEGPGGKVFVPLYGFSGPGSGSSAVASVPRSPTVESPPPSENTLHIAVGDPRRRENIGQLLGTLEQAANAQPKAGSATRTGDPRRSDALRWLFGTSPR